VKILLVDDDRELVDFIAFALQRAGMSGVGIENGAGLLTTVERERPDLIVLEAGFDPGGSLEALRQLRRTSDVPVILLSERADEAGKVAGLEAGADDYITKPLSYRELIARIRARLRSRNGGVPAIVPGGRLEVGPFSMNLGEHRVSMNGRPLSLTVMEYRLLHFLMVNAGRVVPTGVLLRQLWGHEDPGARDVVRVTVYRLRRKLETSPGSALVRTVPGVGVMLEAQPEATAI
jgi:DNA-binding response OmpR family regulator